MGTVSDWKGKVAPQSSFPPSLFGLGPTPEQVAVDTFPGPAGLVSGRGQMAAEGLASKPCQLLYPELAAPDPAPVARVPEVRLPSPFDSRETEVSGVRNVLSPRRWEGRRQGGEEPRTGPRRCRPELPQVRAEQASTSRAESAAALPLLRLPAQRLPQFALGAPRPPSRWRRPVSRAGTEDSSFAGSTALVCALLSLPAVP